MKTTPTLSSSAPPRKALLLAAGFGSRLRPLSYDTPKPLMPLNNTPLLQHAIETMVSFGVTDIIINAHHSAAKILDFCRTFKSDKCRIQLSFEPAILGTGGALRKAAWFFDEPFWMMNTDIVAKLNPKPLLDSFRQPDTIASLWLHSSLGPRTVETKNSIITNFSSNHPGSPGTCTFCGLQLLSPEIFAYLPKTDFCSVIDAYRQALRAGRLVKGITIKDSFWADLGTRERYLNAHRNLKPTQKARNISCCIGKNFHKSGKVQIDASVLWNSVSVADGTIIRDSIIGNNVTLRGRVENSMAVNCAVIPDDSNVLRDSLRRLRATATQSCLIALPPRGSNRTFARILTPQSSAILIRYESEARPENSRYASHTLFLQQHGIRVPRVLLDMPARNATLFEDAGTRSAEAAINNGMPQQKISALYRKVITQLARLHSIPPSKLKRITLEQPFTPTLYRWEHNLFAEHYLHNYLHLPRRQITAILKELETLIPILENESQVLVHRDMQSSNILLKNGTPVIIDYQGMRLGPPQYDLASLLCDPYVMLNQQTQTELLDTYRQALSHKRFAVNCTLEAKVFTAAATQRLCQAIGAYARLAGLPGMRHFEKHIPSALKMLERLSASQTSLPRLAALASHNSG